MIFFVADQEIVIEETGAIGTVVDPDPETNYRRGETVVVENAVAVETEPDLWNVTAESAKTVPDLMKDQVLEETANETSRSPMFGMFQFSPKVLKSRNRVFWVAFYQTSASKMPNET